MHLGIPLLVVSFLAWLPVTLSSKPFQGQLQTNDHLPDLFFLGSDTKVYLHSIPPTPRSDQSTWVLKDGSFSFQNVSQGIYTLDIVSRTNYFPSYRIDIPADDDQIPPQIRIRTRGTSLTSLLSSSSNNLLFHPLIVHSLARLDFFTEPAPLTISSLIGMGGPMFLLGIGALVMVFVIPKISSNLDPELQKEMAQNQANMHKRMAAIQNGDLGALFTQEKEKPKSQTQPRSKKT